MRRKSLKTTNTNEYGGHTNSESGNFPRVLSQMATPKYVLAVVLGPLAASLGPNCSLRLLRGPNLTFGKLPLGKLHIWEVVTWEVVLVKVPNTIQLRS